MMKLLKMIIIYSVSSYVEAKDTSEAIDIKELNTEIKATVAKDR
jgi:hypothetical protein